MVYSARDRIEAQGELVLKDLMSFVNPRDTNELQASRIAGVLGLNNMTAYAVKAYVEHAIPSYISGMISEERISPDYKPTLKEIAEYIDWFAQESRRIDAENEKQKQIENAKKKQSTS